MTDNLSVRGSFRIQASIPYQPYLRFGSEGRPGQARKPTRQGRQDSQCPIVRGEARCHFLTTRRCWT